MVRYLLMKIGVVDVVVVDKVGKILVEEELQRLKQGVSHAKALGLKL